MDSDTFLHLLVAQLRYQNPLAPADPQEQLSQLATFAQVERLDGVLQATTEMLAYSRATAGRSMIGSEVDAETADGPVTGVVESLQIVGGEPLLVLADGTTVPVAAVTAVRGAGAAGTTTAPGATDSDPVVPGTASPNPGGEST